MFNAIAVSITLLDGWGMIGIWTDKFGFHHVWEVWVSNSLYIAFLLFWRIEMDSRTSHSMKSHQRIFLGLSGFLWPVYMPVV